MASTYKETTVKIPALLGPSNLEAWKRAVEVHLIACGADDHISANPPPQPAPDDVVAFRAWKAERVLAWYAMKQSISNVVNELERQGWSSKADDTARDPRALWVAVTTKMGQSTDAQLDGLMEEFFSLDITDSFFHGNVKKYTNRWLEIKRQMEEAGIVVPDRFLVSHLVKGLRKAYPVAVTVALSAHQTDRTPIKIIQSIIENTATLSNDDVTLANTTLPPAVQCTVCTRKSPWPHHEHCGQHHPGGDDQCWDLHPELYEAWREKNPGKAGRAIGRAKDQANARAVDHNGGVPVDRGSAREYTL